MTALAVREDGSYLTRAQIAQLLKGINPRRVGKDGKGFAHLEAYDVRAHLIRVFGFARWSEDLTHMSLLFEESSSKRRKNKEGAEFGDPYLVWTVCYHATVRLTVCSPNGTQLATYTEAATGEATNQPSRGEAHDLAMKTAESQAFKRCAVNLGDNYGLSLYARGSTQAVVQATLLSPSVEDSVEDVQPDQHVPPESLDRGLPAREGIETNNNARPSPAVPPPVVAVRNGEDVPLPVPTSDGDGEVLVDEQAELDKVAQRLADRARQAGGGRGALAEIARLKVQAGSQGLVGRLVTVRDEQHPLGQVLDEAMKAATGGAR